MKKTQKLVIIADHVWLSSPLNMTLPKNLKKFTKINMKVPTKCN